MWFVMWKTRLDVGRGGGLKREKRRVDDRPRLEIGVVAQTALSEAAGR